VTASLFFAFTLWMTLRFGWTAEDVFWAFWVTSFLSTLLILLACLGLYPFFPHAFTAEDPAGERLTGSQKFQAFAVLFFICAVCFIWVHYMAALLAEAFTENPQDRFTLQAISAMATTYWPVLLTGFFLRLEDFLLICLRFMEEKKAPDPEEDSFFALLGLPMGGLGAMWSALVVLVLATVLAEIFGFGKREWIFVPVYAILYLPIRFHLPAGRQCTDKT
jgi:hypothetical protein